jgi:hypothetical protein
MKSHMNERRGCKAVVSLKWRMAYTVERCFARACCRQQPISREAAGLINVCHHRRVMGLCRRDDLDCS